MGRAAYVYHFSIESVMHTKNCHTCHRFFFFVLKHVGCVMSNSPRHKYARPDLETRTRIVHGKQLDVIHACNDT